MHQSCVRSFGESYVQSYHLVRRLEEVMCKIYRCHVKKLSYKKLVEKSYKVTSILKVVLKNYHLGVIVMRKKLYVSVKKLTYKKLVGKKLCIKVTSIVKVVLKNYHLEVIVMLENIIQ